MNNSVRGAACGVIAAVAYGTNPLFSLNLYAVGMDVESVLFYRFAFAALVLAAAMLLTRHSLAVSRRQLMALVPAGVVFAMSSQTLYQSFLYMDAGVACSILFIYPILVAVIMTLFFHERASLLTYGCIALATAGILMFLGNWNEYYFASLLTSSDTSRTLPIALSFFTSEFSYNYTRMFAALAIVIIPGILLYAVAQEQVQASVAATGIKE